MEQKQLLEIIRNVLTAIPHRPFLCLPMSATLYAILKDNHNINAEIATGNLIYNGGYIFKHDFKISKAKSNTYQEWTGHAWVEIDDLICDLSIFRTIYSDKFTKPCKRELIDYFGEGRGCLVASRQQLISCGLTYNAIEYLSDDLATGIIKGFDSLLKTQ